MPNDTILKGPVPLTPIPEGANPYRAIVNGVEHDYEAGSQAPVAPGVAELINAAENFPPAAEEVQPPFAGGGGGGGGGVLVVEAIAGDEGYYINATAKELIDALGEGKLVFVKEEAVAPLIIYGREFIGIARKNDQTGEVIFNSIFVTPTATSPEVMATVWKAATENDKPVADYKR